MILNYDQKPSRSLYFLGANLISVINSKRDQKISQEELYDDFSKLNQEKLSFDYFLLTLDWLYLLNLVEIDEDGDVLKCF